MWIYSKIMNYRKLEVDGATFLNMVAEIYVKWTLDTDYIMALHGDV